jgi:LysM repeat protein
LRKDDYKGWARGLKAAGYATDSRYPQKLIGFIERYQLYKYDTSEVAAGYPVLRPPEAYNFMVHIVKQGDTLYSLSKRYLVSVDELMELNKMNDSRLSIGQSIRIKQGKMR